MLTRAVAHGFGNVGLWKVTITCTVGDSPEPSIVFFLQLAAFLVSGTETVLLEYTPLQIEGN